MIGRVSNSRSPRGSLLRAVKYPDSTNTGTGFEDIDSDDSDVVSFAYNAQGQVILRKDQAGTVHEYVFDDAGRQLHDRVTTFGTGIDDAVRRMSTAYDVLGRVSTRWVRATGSKPSMDIRLRILLFVETAQAACQPATAGGALPADTESIA